MLLRGTSEKIKINYSWRIINVFLTFLSFIIVFPKLSVNKDLFGVFIFCNSLSLYFSYADIGFLNSVQKFAGEEYVNKNLQKETKYIGFITVFLFILFTPFSLSMIFFSKNPNYLLNKFDYSNSIIVSKMFLLLGIITPFHVIIQRIVQTFLSIRFLDFYIFRIEFLIGVFKIISVFFFISEENYDIFSYFLSINLVSLLAYLYILINFFYKEKTIFKYFLSSLKLDSFVLNKSMDSEF
jgi:hypothetical protein